MANADAALHPQHAEVTGDSLEYSLHGQFSSTGRGHQGYQLFEPVQSSAYGISTVALVFEFDFKLLSGMRSQ